MKKVSVPINTYISEIEVPEGQVYYEDLIRRSAENVFAQVMEDYPIIKEYFKLDTEYRKEEKEKSTFIGNKGIYLRCTKNENVGIKMLCPYAYNDTTEITTSTSETNNGFNFGSVASTYLVNYQTNTENISNAVSAILNQAMHWIKIVDDKRIYCFRFANSIFEFEYNDNMFLMYSCPMFNKDFAKVLFTKTTNNVDIMIFTGNYSMYARENTACLAYLLEGTSPTLCKHFNQYAFGFKDNLIMISNVFFGTEFNNNTNNKIIAQLNNKFVNIINDNFNINNTMTALNTRIDIVANGRLYRQILGSLFIDITDDEDE